MKVLLYIFSGVIVFTFSNCIHNSTEIQILPLDILNYADSTSDSGKILINKGEYYLIRNYVSNKKSSIHIDSFVNYRKDSMLNNYENYSIVFYKESPKTNIRNLTEHPRDLDRYSNDHDLLYIYKWSKGNFIYRYKYENGNMVDPSTDINIADIPDTMR